MSVFKTALVSTVLLITAAFIFGLFTFLNDHEENHCEMTYMFEYPQFVRVSVNADPQYYKYSLYAYSEGHFTEKARAMVFDGIPVLFIPGNSGSFRQVRSLASVALRMALDKRPGYHFDYFTVDLNEELSGLNGAVLDGQLEFVNQSLARILQLYRGEYRAPKSVILVGHSMGGILARALLASVPRESTLIPLVITLAAPHVRAPAVVDSYLQAFYKRLENDIPVHSSVISIAGGFNDFLVPSYLTRIEGEGSLHVVTTAVPRVWLPVDHLCILWCKQLVLALNRALFDSVNLKTRQLTHNREQRALVFNLHLVQNSGIRARHVPRYSDNVSLDDRGQWIEHLQRQYSVTLTNGTEQPSWYMFRYVDHHLHEFLTVVAVSLDVTDWAFACPAIFVRGHSKVCYEGIHLTQHTKFAPSVRFKRKILEVNMHELKVKYPDLTHVLVRVLPTDDPVVLHVDVHSPSERTVRVHLPNLLSFQRQTLVEETAEKAVRYDLDLPELEHVTQFYNFYLQPENCTTAFHHATASLIVPWSHDDYHVFVTDTSKNFLSLRLQASKPKGSNETAKLKLTLDPACRYRFSIEPSLVGVLSQFARFYSFFLFPYVAVVILMCLRHQLRTIGTDGSCRLIFTSLVGGMRPYFFLTVVKVISNVLSYDSLTNIFPTPDWTLVASEGMDFFLLPLSFYLVGVGIFWISSVLLASSLVLCLSTVHKIAIRLLARSFLGFVKASDYLLAVLHKLPILVAVGLLLLSLATCGGLSLCLGACFYYLKLAHMSQDLLEELAVKFLRKVRDKLKTKEGVKKDLTPDKPREVPTESEEVIDEGEKAEETAKTEVNESETVEKVEKIGDAEPEKGDVSGRPEDIEKVEDVLEETVDTQAEVTQTKTVVEGAVYFHFSIFLLWVLVACMSVPSVLTWAHNFKYSPSLHPDPFVTSGVILPLCAIPLWQLDLPVREKKWYRELSVVIFVLAFVTLMYATLSLYRLQYFLTAAVAVVVLHQLLAPLRVVVLNGESTARDEYMDKVKAKLE